MVSEPYRWEVQPEVGELVKAGKSPSFAAWCMILHCRCMIERWRHYDDYTSEQSDAINATMHSRLAGHGEPPAAFTQCWVKAQADLYLYHERKATGPRLEYAQDWLRALRIMWREVSHAVS